MAGRLGKSLPFGYRAGTSILHRAPAGVKLLCMLVLSIAAYSSLAGLAAAILTVGAGAAIARIAPGQLLKGSKPIVLLSLCIVLWTTFEPVVTALGRGTTVMPSAAGCAAGIIPALRLLTSFAAAALLFAVTTMRELRLSLGTIEKRVFGTARISLGISLMLGFLPRFFELWETMNLACEARSCSGGLRRFILLIPLVTARMMEAAADTALALEARALP